MGNWPRIIPSWRSVDSLHGNHCIGFTRPLCLVPIPLGRHAPSNPFSFCFDSTHTRCGPGLAIFWTDSSLNPVWSRSSHLSWQLLRGSPRDDPRIFVEGALRYLRLRKRSSPIGGCIHISFPGRACSSAGGTNQGSAAAGASRDISLRCRVRRRRLSGLSLRWFPAPDLSTSFRRGGHFSRARLAPA